MDLEDLAQARVGTTLRGKYRLDRLLGVGGMAAVYEATHRIRTRVALKVLHPHMSTNADIRARFLREGYVANTVEHAGAVKVLDDDVAEDGAVFLAMELLEGETLEGRWQRGGGRMDSQEVARLTHQLLDVLAAAHEKGIVHRDIKPENLFLTRDGVLKVLDFGIARLASIQDVKSATRTGRMMGSPAFMAPEQALGLQRSITGQTDLWSTGATMFTLLSGRYVHDAETVEAMLVFAGSRPAPLLRTVAPEVTTSIATVVDRALSFDMAKRWASAREMQAALEAAYVGVFGVAIPGARAQSAIPALATVVDAPVSIPVTWGPEVVDEAPVDIPVTWAPEGTGTIYQQPLLTPVERTVRVSMAAPQPAQPHVSTTAGFVNSKDVSAASTGRRRTLFLTGAGIASAILAGISALAFCGHDRTLLTVVVSPPPLTSSPWVAESTMGAVSRPSAAVGTSGDASFESLLNDDSASRSRQPAPYDRPDLTNAQLAAPLRHASFITGCGAPDDMKVTVRVAVRAGRAVGVTVSTNPSNPTISACIDRAVRGLRWPDSPNTDFVQTTY